MKKSIIVIFSLTCICFLIGCSFPFGNGGTIDEVSEHLELYLDGAMVLSEWDTHGGFHGDGEAFAKILCKDSFEKSLNSRWRALPLTGEAYQYFYEWGGVFEHPETGGKVIPEVENGYWYFKSTGQMNWIFALYDCNSDILYFYKFDA